MSIVLAIIIFSLIILIHEFGHFLLAKKNGICVTEFSLGMGPRLAGFTKGETKYSLKILPFGGSCMMLGEDGESSDERSFGVKSVGARISVVIAGPMFNFILAFILSLFIIGNIGYDSTKVSMLEGYPAEEAGMQTGDQIVKMNNQRISIYREITLFVQLHQGETVNITYERDGEQYTAVVTPQYSEEIGSYLLGFTGGESIKGNALETIKYSFYEVRYWITVTVKSLGMLFEGKVSVNDVSGPVGIVSVIGTTYQESKSSGMFYILMNMLYMTIFLSANLGVMNLLPIPALDGGRLVFLILEGIRGKPISQEKEGMVHFIGFMFLMLIMVLVMYNDIRRLI